QIDDILAVEARFGCRGAFENAQALVGPGRLPFCNLVAKISQGIGSVHITIIVANCRPLLQIGLQVGETRWAPEVPGTDVIPPQFVSGDGSTFGPCADSGSVKR